MSYRGGAPYGGPPVPPPYGGPPPASPDARSLAAESVVSTRSSAHEVALEMAGSNTSPLPPGARIIHADPEYMKGYTTLRKKADAWMRAAADKRPLPILPGEESVFWGSWLRAADANNTQPSPNHEMRQFVDFQMKSAAAPPTKLPSKEEAKAQQRAKRNRRSMLLLVLFIIFILVGGATAAAYFAYTYSITVADLEKQLQDAKAANTTCGTGPEEVVPEANSTVAAEVDQLVTQLRSQVANQTDRADQLQQKIQDQIRSTNAAIEQEEQNCELRIQDKFIELQQAASSVTTSLISGQPVPAENAAAYSTSGASWRWDYTLDTSGAVVRYRNQPTDMSFSLPSRNTWKSGFLPAGFGTGYAWNTPLDQATTNGNYVIFLTSFCLTDAQLARLADAKMFLFVARDDNAVVQLNGVNIMDEPHTVQSEMVYWNEVIEVPATRLVSGRNVIKAALTNIGQSAEAGFDADLRVVNGPALQLTDFC
eukprot:jgi/Tetstr1/436733/TSEL_025516.t1